MKTVIVISEECHGTIGYAYDVYSAVMFLLGDHWIDENTVVDELGMTIKEKFGILWQEELSGLTIDQFNNLFEDRFLLIEEKVIWFP